MLLLFNVGTILKATVDYIRKMQRDMDRYRAHEIRTKQMEDSMRLLKLRIQVCVWVGGWVCVWVCGWESVQHIVCGVWISATVPSYSQENYSSLSL